MLLCWLSGRSSCELRWDTYLLRVHPDLLLELIVLFLLHIPDVLFKPLRTQHTERLYRLTASMTFQVSRLGMAWKNSSILPVLASHMVPTSSSLSLLCIKDNTIIKQTPVFLFKHVHPDCTGWSDYLDSLRALLWPSAFLLLPLLPPLLSDTSFLFGHLPLQLGHPSVELPIGLGQVTWPGWWVLNCHF